MCSQRSAIELTNEGITTETSPLLRGRLETIWNPQSSVIEVSVDDNKAYSGSKARL